MLIFECKKIEAEGDAQGVIKSLASTSFDFSEEEVLMDNVRQ